MHPLQAREECLSEKPVRLKFLTLGDVARLCQVSPKTVYKWVEIGSLHSFKTPGGQRRFYRDEVQVFMRAHGFLRSWEPMPEEKT